MGWEKEPEDGVVEGLLGFEVVVDVVVVVVGRAEVLRWWSSTGSDGSTSSSLFSCKLRIKIAFRKMTRERLFRYWKETVFLKIARYIGNDRNRQPVRRDRSKNRRYTQSPHLSILYRATT